MDDLTEDEDTDDVAVGRSEMPTGTISAVFDVDTYLSCPRQGCRNTKLTTLKEENKELYLMFCKNCNVKYRASSSNVYLRVTAMLESSSLPTGSKKITLFAPAIQKMLNSRGLDDTILFDPTDMMVKILQVVPIDIKYSLNNSTVKDLVCKRAASPSK